MNIPPVIGFDAAASDIAAKRQAAGGEAAADLLS
jgi:hypothetical protein